jgi:hypothetical protein
MRTLIDSYFTPSAVQNLKFKLLPLEEDTVFYSVCMMFQISGRLGSEHE